jgi:hypothetical protein
LLETVCTSLWVVDDGLAVPFAGGWREWRAAVADGWTATAAAEREVARLRPPERVRTRPIAAATAGGASAGAGAAGADRSRGGDGSTSATAVAPPPARGPGPRREKLSKDAYRRQKAAVDAELTRLGLRKTQLELSMGSPAIAANFVEMRRVTSELADVEGALAAAEEAWLELEERAP